MIGTSISGRAGDTGRRESAAQAALEARAAEGDVACVNVAFADESASAGVIPQLRALRQDARVVSGIAGARKPLVSEMLDVLAAEASRRDIGRIALVNGDIVVTPEAVARAIESQQPAIAISRTDVGGQAGEEELLYGVDMFVFDVAFWRRERRRFRSYVLGEPVWDNVYAAIVASHGGSLLNRERLILHERHPSVKSNSPYMRYTQYLAAGDSSYFSVWCTYVARAQELRARGGSHDEEYALQRAVFVPPGATARILDIARGSWWRVRRALGA